MSKLSGVFELFPSLDRIPLENITSWLPRKVEPHSLENFIGNRILYPQSVSATEEEMEIDLALLREAVRLQNSPFLKKGSGDIVIPNLFENRFPLIPLVWALIDSLKLKPVVKVLIKRGTILQTVGSVVSLANFKNGETIEVKLGEKTLKLQEGSLTRIPLERRSEKIAVNNQKFFNLTGGRAGVFLDLRSKNDIER